MERVRSVSGLFNYKKFKLCFNDLEFIKDVEDDKIDLFLLGYALHSGKNWAYWVKRNLKNDSVVKYLVQVIKDINYDRPRLRTLYALQQFPQDQVLDYLENIANPAAIQILEEYVVKKRWGAFSSFTTSMGYPPH